MLGVPVSAVTLDGAVDRMADAIRAGRREHVCVCSVNMVVLARKDPALARALQTASLVVPDGWPITQVGRWRGRDRVGRVRGADLVRAFVTRAARDGFSIFLVGGAPGVADRMADALRRLAPGVRVVGAVSPPFRDLTEPEEEALAKTINASGADVVFIGLGCPKQERWMLRFRQHLNAPVLVGVGAAFDFLAGTLSEAPRALRAAGLEWLWRFGQEPRRLWRRVFLDGPAFAGLLVVEEIRLRR